MSIDTNPLELIDSISSSEDEEDFLKRLQAVGRAIGYDHVLFGVELRAPFWDPVQYIKSAYPIEFQMVYQEKGFLGVDPTVPHCQTYTTPLVWDESMYGAPVVRAAGGIAEVRARSRPEYPRARD
jgi:hypothetical protein